ncbi:MAG: ABC transporter substrate binding protein [Paracoccaceae bacterium]
MRALLLALLILSPPLAAAADGAPFDGWFSVAAPTQERWDVAPVPGDGRQVLIRSREPAKGAPLRVMVIYPRRSSAYDVAMTTLLKEFAERPFNLEFLAVNFDGDPDRGEALLAEAESGGVALIYAMGSETVEWLHGRSVDPSIPVVSICAKDPVQLGQMPDYLQGSGRNIAFTSLNVLIDVQVEHLRELKPDLKNLAILVDEMNISAVETQARPIAAAVRTIGADAFEVGVTDPARAREELAVLVPEAVARMRRSDPTLEHSLFWITGSTSVFAEIETINAHSDRVPVLSVVPDVVQAGESSAVLSIGVSFESNAQLAAVYGAEILSGARGAGDMPVGLVSPPDIAVNFLRARRIGLRTPFAFFETATFVYGPDGAPVRVHGQSVLESSKDQGATR